MEQKCSNSSHKENKAISFCQECKIYMCNKCEKLHSEFIESHHQIRLEKDKNIGEIFTGLCKENNHQYELKYFCKVHNILCCAECITKIKGKDFGQHSDCEVCSINDIETEKKNKLKQNIKTLEELFINLKDSINQIKILFEQLEKDKEEIKLKIQTAFTKIRKNINEKEDELLSLVENKYNKEFFDENIIKQSESLPKKIEKSLEKGKLINNYKENNENIKLNKFINDCLNIENRINDVDKIKNNINKYNSFKNQKIFYFNDMDLEGFCKSIQNLKYVYPVDFNKSEIISKDDFIKINNWIGGNKNFILKYSTKKDSCNTNIFHEKCDNIEGSVFICKVKDSDIIGGYVSAKIEKKEEFLDDEKAFLFNLTQNFTKTNKKSFKNAIKNFNNSSHFIRFGSDCEVLSISGNCLNDKKSYAYNCSCSCNYDTASSNLFNKNEGTFFQVEILEVFQVI